MDWLKNLKTVYKLGLLIFIAALALAIVSAIGYYDLKAGANELNIMYQERLVPVDTIGKNLSAMRRVDNATLELMLNRDETKKQALAATIQQQYQNLDNDLAKIANSKPEPEVKALLDAIMQPQQQHRLYQKQIMDLVYRNQYQEAYEVYQQQMDPLTVKIVSDMQV